jgi:hypothetical protein
MRNIELARWMLNMHGRRGARVTGGFYTDQVDALYQLLKSRQLLAAHASLAGESGIEEASSSPRISRAMFYGARQFCGVTCETSETR